MFEIRSYEFVSFLRSSKRSSIKNADHHQQELCASLNSSYRQQQRQTPRNQTMIHVNYASSVDDTDNEDLDTLSDFDSYHKIIRASSPASIADEVTPTDSKLLPSSGYQSLKSLQPIINKTISKNDCHYCPNCVQKPETVITPPTLSIKIIQPIKNTFMKCFNFLFISKNILVLPLFIFLLRQRRICTAN